MESLCLCFTNDQSDFIDVFKYEKLLGPLCKQIELYQLEHYVDFVEYSKNTVVQCIIKLINLISDDYKWKSLQHAVNFLSYQNFKNLDT